MENKSKKSTKSGAKQIAKSVAVKTGEILLGAVLTFAAIPPLGALLLGLLF